MNKLQNHNQHNNQLHNRDTLPLPVKELKFVTTLLLIAGLALGACTSPVNVSAAEYAQKFCTQPVTFLASDVSGYQITAPTICGNSRIEYNGNPVIQIIPSRDPNEVLGQASAQAVRNSSGTIIGCTVNNMSITGQGISQQEFTAIASKELDTVKACGRLGDAGYLAKHDSKSSDDPTGGLGNVIEVLDGTTYLQLYAEDRPAAHFIINEPPPPKWVTDTLDKATTDTNVLGCAQAQAIDMLGQNGVIRLQDVFGQELQEACASK